MTTSNTDTGGTSNLTVALTEINTVNNGITDSGETIVSPRESLITTAVNFLQNTKVRHTTLMQKQQFLQSKGLTVDEIQIACERAGAFSQDPNSTVINMDLSTQTHSKLALQPQPLTIFGKIKEVAHSMAVISGLVYAVYLFWKKYVEPFLFGKKKKKTIDESLEEIDKKVEVQIGEVNQELCHIKDLAQQQREHNQQINREFSNFRNDLDTIKGLLLNRKQFATNITTGPPSIPAWQLASSPHHHIRHSQSEDIEKADDAGSGSGSSETEVVTKNSDSSLEIM